LEEEIIVNEIILSPKDNINKTCLKNVETFTLEGNTLLVVFQDGKTRNYPLMHLWYYEAQVPSGDKRSKPPKQ